MKIIVILPTYNEKANIGRMIDRLFGVFASVPDDMNILVVDDNSPDGTQDLVKAKQGEYPKLFLITGQKEGLGKAYVRGMEEAMRMGADAIFEMDADFSHDPDDVPRLIKCLGDGADFVIGSRYVPGGSIPREWSFYRQLNSKFGNIVARYLAGIRAIKDCTAGFRCIRTDLLARIDLSTIRTQGYGFQVSLLHAAFVNGARIQEIPVRFTDRIAGESKLGLKDIIEFVLNAGAIRLRSSETFLRFSAVGCSGILVNLGFFMALSNWGCSKFVASAISIALSILWNFIWNYHWTFRARQSSAGVSLQGLQFNLISLVTFGCSFGTFALLCVLFPEQNPLYFQVFGIIPATLLNYFLNSYWTFVDRKNMLG